MKILVIEDYTPLRESITQGLREAGYLVESTGDGEEGLWFARNVSFGLIILDLMIPSLGGMEVLKALRQENNPVSILILTAKDSLDDKVGGLEQGADDYLVKPFAFRELLARIRSLLRRSYSVTSTLINISGLTLDLTKRKVYSNETEVLFTAKEYNLFELLALQDGKIVSRDEIWDSLFDFASDPSSNLIDVYISNIRSKLKAAVGKPIIQTRRGMGYFIESEPV